MSQVTAQALAISAKAGPSDVTALMKEGASEDDKAFGHLASLPNILDEVLFPEPTVQAKLPSGKVGLHKAALVSFQTWYLRTPGLAGIVFGQAPGRAGQKSKFVTLLVAESLEKLLADDKVSKLRRDREVHPVGIVMAGHSEEEDKFLELKKWCKICLDQGADVAACVLENRQQAGFAFSSESM